MTKVPLGGSLVFFTCRIPDGSKELVVRETGMFGRPVERRFNVRECPILRVACRINGVPKFTLDGKPFTAEKSVPPKAE